MAMLAGLITAGVVFLGINNLMGLNRASLEKQIFEKENVPLFVVERDTELVNPINIGSKYEEQQPYSGIDYEGPFGLTQYERMSQPGTFWYDYGTVNNDY